MPADAGIFAQIQPVRPRNMLADFADIAQIQGLQQRQQLGAMQMDDMRRARAQEEKASGVYRNALLPDGTMNRNAVLSGFAQAGLGHKIPGLQKQFAEQDKAEAESKGKLLENTKRRVDLAGQAFGFVRANPTLENANSVLDSLGQQQIFTPEQVAQYKAQIAANPASIPALAEQAFRSALDAKEQLAKIETRDTGGAVQTLATDPVTMQQRTLGSVQKTATPGELIASQDRRAALGESARHNRTMEGFRSSEVGGVQYVTDAAGNTFAVPKKAGNGPIQAIPVLGQDGKPLSKGAGGKPLTDAQAKANLFGTRMQESHRILNELEGKYSPLAVNAKMGAAEMPFIGGSAGAIGNLMLTEDGQQAEQAQRDFINAVLRRESGAVISPAEFANGQKQYFPQPGDSAKVLAQKRRNRELAISGLQVEVPGGFRVGPSLTNPGGNAGGATGDVGDDPLGLRNGR